MDVVHGKERRPSTCKVLVGSVDFLTVRRTPWAALAILLGGPFSAVPQACQGGRTWAARPPTARVHGLELRHTTSNRPCPTSSRQNFPFSRQPLYPRPPPRIHRNPPEISRYVVLNAPFQQNRFKSLWIFTCSRWPTIPTKPTGHARYLSTLNIIMSTTLTPGHRTDNTCEPLNSPILSMSDPLRHIALTYQNADSHASALSLILALRPEWKESQHTIEFVRFKDGITNTVR